MFIFGSPQFGPPAMEMNDLQRVIGDGQQQVATERQSSPRRTGRGASGGGGSGQGPSATSSSRTNW